MRRIYFLLPNVQSAKGIVDELLLKRIEWRHIHVLAHPGVRLEDLPQATLAQRSDLLPALARLVGRAAAKSQVIVVTHAPPLITALEKEAVCHSVTLEKNFGETTIRGAKQMDLPAWHWPAR